MLLSYLWLKTYLPKVPAPEKLTELMLLHGLDVESTTSTNAAYDHVVVGEIVGIRPHPNADKLRLADVVVAVDGPAQEIVCGAPNIAIGQKVPVALLGATLPNGVTIEPRAIRGVTSNGMLCARDELGLGSDHSGIFVLDPKTKVGTPLAQVLDQDDDTIFDVTTPANRADLMSMRGLAWEIGAILGQRPSFPAVKLPASGASERPEVTAVDQQLCARYTLRAIRGLTMQASPTWLQQRLQAAGMRPINVVVDVTNYIMLEYGQPLHAFDAQKLSGPIEVRAAVAGEQLTTLDNKARQLDPTMLVIADHHGPVALAGVMGGAATEVTDQTTDIYLEAAIFHPVAIRKTSRRLGLVSEASKRFEKGLWLALPQRASHAAAALLVELCGGSVGELVSVGQEQAPQRTVTMPPAMISARLGLKVTAATSKKHLEHLGFTVAGTAKAWTVTVPEWRPDVSLPEDVIDEVGRMLGYDDVPSLLPTVEQVPEVALITRQQEELRNALAELGFTEIISHAFYGQRQGLRESGQHFMVANPLDQTQELLRKELQPQLFDVLKRQADAGEDAMVFELGRVFDPACPSEIAQQQPWKLALGMTHKLAPQLPQIVHQLLQRLGTAVQPETLMVMEKTVRGRKIELGQFDLRALLASATWTLPDWDPTKFVTTGTRHHQQSKFPAVKRDIAFWWTKDEAAITLAVKSANTSLLQGFETTDRFEKNGQTSYKVSFVYQAADRTLSKAEVDMAEEKIKSTLIAQGAIIR